MANPFRQGSFVPLTDVYDDQLLRSIDVNSEQFKDFLVRLRNTINTIAIVLNTKDTGYYVQDAFVNGQIFFPNPALNSTTGQQPTFRQVFRKVINFGALPNATTISVPHNIPITDAFTFTRIYGCATDGNTEFIPIPYASGQKTYILAVTNDGVELNVDPVNVNITTAIDYSAYTTTYVVLEYLNQ